MKGCTVCQVIPVEDASELASRVKRHRLVIVPDASHLFCPHDSEEQAALLCAVVEFLKGVEVRCCSPMCA